MANYVISCCSTADLSEEHFKERDINYICFHYYLNGVAYPDDLGKTVSFPDFYKALSEGGETKTSQVNADEFVDYFSSFLEKGLDIIHVCLSSGISGVFNSANIAKSDLEEKYPDRKIYVVDSLGASSGYGLLMDSLADLRDKGRDIDTVYHYAMENRLRLNHWFFSTDLTFYVKGGRISKVSGWFGTALKICPLLNMDNQGRLIPREKIRTKNAVMKAIVDRMEQHADGGAQYSGKCYISNAGCPADAEEVAKMIEQRFRHLDGKVLINSVGTTIGSHTGPGTIAVFFWGDTRGE